MDYDLWLKFSLKHKFYYIDKSLASIRLRPGTKMYTSLHDKFPVEWRLVSRRYWSRKSFLWYCYLRLSFARHQAQAKSRRLYEEAVRQYRLSEKKKCLKYTMQHMLCFPPSIFKRNTLSLLGRAILGERSIKTLGRFLKR